MSKLFQNNQNWHYPNKNKLTTIYLKDRRQNYQNYFKTIKIDIIRTKIYEQQSISKPDGKNVRTMSKQTIKIDIIRSMFNN